MSPHAKRKAPPLCPDQLAALREEWGDEIALEIAINGGDRNDAMALECHARSLEIADHIIRFGGKPPKVAPCPPSAGNSSEAIAAKLKENRELLDQLYVLMDAAGIPRA